MRKQAEIDLKESEERYRELYEEVESARQRLERLSRQLVESQEQERRRVALELHDEIGQLLTAIKLSLDTTDLSVPQAAQAKLESAKELTNELASKVRDLSLRLRPAMLDDLGLLPTLLWYVKWYTSQNHIQVDLQQAGLSKQRFLPCRDRDGGLSRHPGGVDQRGPSCRCGKRLGARPYPGRNAAH